jgi:serine-type D-Ala-D-Ala carboxypeptidase (penicillin-binding protein 5/6)
MKTKNKTINKILLVSVGIVVALLLIPVVTQERSVLSSPQVLGTQTEELEQDPLDLSLRPSPELAENLPLPEISAKSALAYDLNSGSMLYTKNFDQKLPIASLTKLISALVILDHANFDDEILIEREDAEVIGSKMGLVPGEIIKVIHLLQGMLISSSNDATIALARHVAGSEEEFVVMMNQKAKELGLTSSNFSNPVGLDSADNYSTTFDLGKVVAEFITKPDLDRIVQIRQLRVSSTEKKYNHVLTSTNKLLLEDPSILGIKTGYTDEAQGNLIVRKKQGAAEVVTIVLGSNNREDDTNKLLDWIFGSYRW